MADLTITAANVVSYGTTSIGTAGATITAGQVVRLNTSLQLVLASDDSATNASIAGIALHGASSGQPLAYHVKGSIDVGATLSVGKVYVVSTSGAICPVDDIASGEYITILGVATASNRLLVNVTKSGVAAAAAVT